MPGNARSEGPVELATIWREWIRIGITGFGGPPAHIALLRRLVVQRRRWMSPTEFEDGVAVVNLLPGPASTQLAIFTAWRVRGVAGALVGGFCFIAPGLVVILALSAVFLAKHPPAAVTGAAAGAGAAVPAVAAAAAISLIPASWDRAGRTKPGRARAGRVMAGRVRWLAYLAAGAAAAVAVGPWLVLLLAGCGLSEMVWRAPKTRRGTGTASFLPPTLLPGAARAAAKMAVPVPVTAGMVALIWVAFKVGALSYGGGFVIIPLIQHDAVHTYHWMSASQFLAAVALGQVTPGPVVLTVAVVGYAADGVVGGLVATVCAFAPSFLFVLFGARHFDRLRHNPGVQAFLTGAGPAAIGGIAGSTITLGLALQHWWQAGLLAGAGVWLIGLRRNLVAALLGSAAIGAVIVLAGAGG